MVVTDGVIVGRILGILGERGARQYGGEAVSQLEHALQAADLARRERAPDALVAAALLHDLGHLLDGADGLPALDADDHHEARGAAFLRGAFPDAVVTPIALHVAAKRYLCAVDPSYQAGLSPASDRSLGLQGGALSPGGCERFRRQPHWEAAVRLRGWDDLAKVPGRATSPLESHRALLEGCLRRVAIDR